MSQKSCHALGLLAPNRYELDLSNEVLNIHFGQGTAKISEVKVGGYEKLPTQPGSTDVPHVRLNR